MRGDTTRAFFEGFSVGARDPRPSPDHCGGLEPFPHEFGLAREEYKPMCSVSSSRQRGARFDCDSLAAVTIVAHERVGP